METEYILTSKNLNFHIDTNFFVQNCNKVILPKSFLNNFELTEKPVFLEIKSIIPNEIARTVYCSVQEFTAPENTIFLAPSLIIDAMVPENTQLIIQQIFPPTVTKIVFKNMNNSLSILDHWESEKKKLEKVLVSNYQILQECDMVRYNNEELEIDQLEPNNVVSLFMSDPEIEFSNVYKKIKTEPEMKPLPPKPRKNIYNFSKRNKMKSFHGVGRNLN
jgi:hypothetical protein